MKKNGGQYNYFCIIQIVQRSRQRQLELQLHLGNYCSLCTFDLWILYFRKEYFYIIIQQESSPTQLNSMTESLIFEPCYISHTVNIRTYPCRMYAYNRALLEFSVENQYRNHCSTKDRTFPSSRTLF